MKSVFLHSSNEMYGADKILLEIMKALPDEDRRQSTVHLPDDLPPSQNALEDHLGSLGAENRISPLPVLRRRYLRPRGVLPLIKRMWGTWRQLRLDRPDLVYCTTSAMVLCMPLARLAGVKRVTLHVQEIWSAKEAPVLGTFARAADRIVCISDAVRESLPHRLKGRAVTLLNAHRESDRDFMPVAHDGPGLTFLVASRWNSWKGHKTLLAAWDQEECPGNLVVLGGPPSVGIGVDVRQLAASVKHSDRISIVGEVSDITPYLDLCDFLVLPSDQPEPFGLVLLEAFSRGRAVVASNGGGARDVVSEGHDGLLFTMSDAQHLSSQLLSLDRSTAIRMGANARRTYEAKYSIEAYSREFQEFWNPAGNYEGRKIDAHS
ncbi:glycosyltransferase family 4 protein [Arthrobacter sp. M4]|uniref:glycosyltransferase family 4 protein n=1 Tax=Arthrobacter sp. M4 TaxID=218160 RepID=UPI001CDD1C8B|nr:glycosyltransferase family 4 protein [Arthrobacter sp. M4]MCA4133067.1 glycosyltransferase family 4 protein [Arthrobacter sp. M4]